MTPAQRAMHARLASRTSWAKTSDREQRTRPARTAFLARFEKQVDPDGVLPEIERAERAHQAFLAHMETMRLKSSLSRARRRQT